MKNQYTNFRIINLILLVFICLTCCAKFKKSKNKPNDSTSSSTSAQNGSAETAISPWLYIPIKINDSSLGLVDTATPSAFQMAVQGCDSGINFSLTNLSTSAKVYINDKNCLAKLTQFTINGLTYTPKLNAGFVTYLTGEVATFTEAGGTELSVKVISNISTPAVTGDVISYTFYSIKEGPGSQTILDVSLDKTGSDLEDIGEIAPAFELMSVQMLLANVGNELSLKFKLQCTTDLTNTVPNSDSECDSKNLTDISYTLVTDTLGGAPSLGDIQTVWSNAAVTWSIDPTQATELILLGNSSLAHGGFFTKSGGDALQAPTDFTTAPNMVLILKWVDTSNGNESYRYYHVVIDVQKSF